MASLTPKWVTTVSGARSQKVETHFGVDANRAKSQGSRRPQTACGNPGLEAEIPLGLTKKKAELQRTLKGRW